MNQKSSSHRIVKVTKYLLVLLTLFLTFVWSLSLDSTIQVQTTDPYYLKLKKQCNGSNCCLASLQDMITAQSKLATNNTCPEGYRLMIMMCIDSYRWCERDETDTQIRK